MEGNKKPFRREESRRDDSRRDDRPRSAAPRRDDARREGPRREEHRSAPNHSFVRREEEPQRSFRREEFSRGDRDGRPARREGSVEGRSFKPRGDAPRRGPAGPNAGPARREGGRPFGASRPGQRRQGKPAGQRFR